MDDVDSFRQGGLVFVHRKENADAANNNWWKDGVKYLTEPRTFMRSIQNSGGQNIMQQIEILCPAHFIHSVHLLRTIM